MDIPATKPEKKLDWDFAFSPGPEARQATSKRPQQNLPWVENPLWSSPPWPRPLATVPFAC